MLISPEYDDLDDTISPCLRIGADSLRNCRMKGSLAFGGSTAISGNDTEISEWAEARSKVWIKLSDIRAKTTNPNQRRKFDTRTRPHGVRHSGARPI